MVNRLDIIKDERFQNIYFTDVFPKEYKRMFGKSKKQYELERNQLAINLSLLDTDKQAALEQKQFHAITGHHGLYSIRHVSVSNPRVIFVFAESDTAIVLLSCTLEKSKNDYNEAIALAEQRLRLLEED